MGYSHPLDPLSAAEIKAAAAACRTRAAQEKVASLLRFNAISLQEPAKHQLVAYDTGRARKPARRAFCILQAWPKHPVIEAVVDLGSSRPSVISWKPIHGVQALAHPEDCILAEDIAKADPEVQRKLRDEYGITDLALVACDPWSVHGPPVEGRLIQLWLYKRSSPDDNHYAHPIEFVPFVDLNKRKVVHMELPHSLTLQVPERDVNYHSSLFSDFRSGLRPLVVSQPQGPSFEMEGNLIKWQKWQFRLGFNFREGVVLHQVGYEDQGRVRPILHRASLVEMAVPYGDVNEPFQRKCAFDVGDYGLGYCANSLELGCDCLGHIQYFDAILNDTKGNPMVIKKAVCLHEEDAGILWKHMEYRNGHAEVRRSRRLVISFISTVVNYEYLFYYSLYQDGTIDYQIKLTGELSTNALSKHELDMGSGQYGTIVTPEVNAQNHQHMFCARLDFAVDCEHGGRSLVVTETNVESLGAGSHNPFGNGFRAVETELRNEQQAKRVANPQTSRTWKIKNPLRINPITRTPIAYKMMTNAAPTILAVPGSLLASRGEFATQNLWVTPHHDAENFPAGDYPLQSNGGEGIGKWTRQNRTVSGCDPVVWHAFGVTHFPRIEDFPVMPVEVVGFTLKPVNFFDGNPGVDVPPEHNNGSKLNNCCQSDIDSSGNAKL